MRKSILALLMLAALGPATAQAGVSVEYASQVDFSQYQSFSFEKNEEVHDAELEAWLQEAVARELLAKGLKKVDQGGDLLVRTRADVHEQQRTEVNIVGERVIWNDDITSATPTGEMMRQVGLGIAVVELLDGHSRLQVWQGVVGVESRPEVGKQSEKRLNKLIAKMFKKYPPQ